MFKRNRTTLTSRAEVLTDAPGRYAKQLVSHLGHRIPVTETAQGSVLAFDGGHGTVRAADGAVVLEAVADGAETLATIQDVLGRHLERFGAKAQLVVTWSPPVDGAQPA
jgi:uncharacterized protein